MAGLSRHGSPKDIYETPNSRMTAEFIGSCNMFEGEIIEDEADHVVIRSHLLDAPVRISHGISSSQDNHQVWVAVRPEKTRLSRTKPDKSHNWSEGVVDDIAYLGTHSVYYIRLPSGQIVQSNNANTDRHGDSLDFEETCFVSWESASPVVLNN